MGVCMSCMLSALEHTNGCAYDMYVVGNRTHTHMDASASYMLFNVRTPMDVCVGQVFTQIAENICHCCMGVFGFHHSS